MVMLIIIKNEFGIFSKINSYKNEDLIALNLVSRVCKGSVKWIKNSNVSNVLIKAEKDSASDENLIKFIV